MSRDRDSSRALFSILAAAALARVAVLLLLPPQLGVHTGDTWAYVRDAWLLAHGEAPFFPPVAPAFAWLLASAWAFFPDAARPGALPDGYLTLVRACQVVASVGTVAAAVALARRFSGGRRACLVTGAGLALGPAFVAEPFQVMTETLFLAFFLSGLFLSADLREKGLAAQIPAGIVFGLAALTRPVVAAFPFLLALWLAAPDASPGRGRRFAPVRGLVLVLSFLATVAPWSWSLKSRGGSFVPQGFSSNLWLGSVGSGDWPGSKVADERRSRFANGPDDYAGEVAAKIRTEPLAWIRLRIRNLGVAILQPHFAWGLVESAGTLRTSFDAWTARGRRVGELPSLLARPAAGLKIVLGAVHALALALGIAGFWRWRRRWRDAFPIFAGALYFPAVHAVLTALPRYVFPAEFVLWVAAALAFTPPGPETSARLPVDEAGAAPVAERGRVELRA